MSSSNVPNQDWPNLVCPGCGYQFRANDVSSLDYTSFQTLVETSSCRSCGEDVHPEDALLEYFKESPNSEIKGRPIEIGSRADIGTIELDVGKIREKSLLGGDAIEIESASLAETDRPPGQNIMDMTGDQLTWYPEMIVNDEVYVNIGMTSETDIGFVTSELDSSAPDELTVAYSYFFRPEDIVQPSWVKLLSNAASLYNHNRGIAMLPILMAAYDNHLAHQLRRTLKAEGRSESDVQQFLEDDYWGWKDRSKEGLEELTTHRFPAYAPSLYQDFYDIRTLRNNEIIHVDSNDDVADLSHNVMRNCFDTTMRAILTIHEICYQGRMNN